MKKLYTSLFTILALLTISIPQNLSAQSNITLAQTESYLNGKFKGNYTFEVNKRELTMCVFKDKKKIREDKVSIMYIDPRSVKYSEEEKAIIFKCGAEAGDCINRKVILHDQTNKGQFSRVNIIVDGFDEKSIKGIKRALIHMMMLIQDPKYDDNTPFED